MKLSEIIDLQSGLVDLLLSRGCISERHKEAARSKKDNFESNMELLKIIQRRSYADFLKIAECFRDPNILQSHVADILLKTGGKFHSSFPIANLSDVGVLIFTLNTLQPHICVHKTAPPPRQVLAFRQLFCKSNYD